MLHVYLRVFIENGSSNHDGRIFKEHSTTALFQVLDIICKSFLHGKQYKCTDLRSAQNINKALRYVKDNGLE